MRLYLPKTILEPSSEAGRARIALKKAADVATAKMNASSARFLAGGRIKSSVISGQKTAAADIGVRFGGPNQALIDRLNYSIARDLGKASASPNAFLADALRRTTAIAVQADDRADKTLRPKVFNQAVSTSLEASAQRQETFPLSAKSLLEDLGLDKGDQVLFMSGYRMEAEAYAKTLVRTRSLEALNEAKAGEYLDNGFLYVETSEHDGVDPRDICYFLQGQIWALAPNPEGIPILPREYGLPPWHPNCLHTFGAWQPKYSSKTFAEVLDSHSSDAEDMAPWLVGGKARAFQLAGASKG